MKRLKIMLNDEVITEYNISTDMDMTQQASNIRQSLVTHFANTARKYNGQAFSEVPEMQDIDKAILLIESIFDLEPI
jgi:hypothetical protein